MSHCSAHITSILRGGGARAPQWARTSSFTRFLDHTQRRTTVGRTPLDKWSARRGDLYLTAHDTHNRQTFMPPVGFELTVSAGELPQTYLVDRAVTGTGIVQVLITQNLTGTLGYLCFWGETPDNTSNSRACQTIEVQGLHISFFILSFKIEVRYLTVLLSPPPLFGGGAAKTETIILRWEELLHFLLISTHVVCYISYCVTTFHIAIIFK
jgi:hypothetical protein